MKKSYSLVDVIVPPSCMACGDVLSESEETFCLRCSARIPDSVCSVRSPGSIRACWSLGPYAGPLGALIRTAKYRRSLPVADRLGGLLGARLKGVVQVDAVVHVPTPWFRKIYRGFDPSSRIARSVAQSIGVPHRRLLRRKNGSRQVGKAADVRKQLRAEAFGVAVDSFPNRVLLIDDVMTTGATLRAAAMCLQNHGVKHVYAALVAHA